MTTLTMPPPDEMYGALLRRDATYDGVFFTGVRTTGIFCKPTCPARKPLRDHVEFFRTSRDALFAGYRPCRRCKPLEPGGRAPEWLEPLLERLEKQPSRRWRDSDLRQIGVDPHRVRRWFQANHGMTFHSYQRSRRLGMALEQIRDGGSLTTVAFDSGYESLSGFRDAFGGFFGETPGRSTSIGVALACRILTPLGPMVALATDEGLCLLEFADRPMLETQIKRVRRRLKCSVTPGSNVHLEQAEREVTEYFDGGRTSFDVALHLSGTPFQMEIWRRLIEIPYGSTRSYEELARLANRPGAQRAVGRANGDNRIALIVPCHRVVGSDGQLRGYGGGVWRKRHLLEHEHGGRR